MTVSLLNMDCMDYMKTCKDNEFDLAIVDPPYGINEGKSKESRNRFASNNYASKNWDNKQQSKEYFVELQRVSRNQIIWGANHFMHNIMLGSSCWIVWDKVNGGSDFADCELAYTSFKSAVRKFTFMWAGMLQGNMKNKEVRIHPTQKPVALYNWLLKNYAKKGQKILDTHLGSASSAISAYYFGCEFTGIEIDADYYVAACKRYIDETAQGAMF